MKTQSELRLETLLGERETVQKLHETVIGAVEANEGNVPSESQAQQITQYREKATALDTEIAELSEAVEANRRAVESAKAIRRTMAGNLEGVEVEDDGILYRDFYTYARDYVLTRDLSGAIALAKQYASPEELEAMRARQMLMKRTPANTLSSDVGGLQPAQHIDQIFQVIDKSRALVASARRTTLERRQLQYPKVTSRPVVSVQASEKTEAGNTKLQVDMETTTASTYLGGGDLSWQAVNWSTPDALQLWFDIAAADYALKTEQDAAQVLQHSAFTYDIGSPIGGSPAFEDFMTAVGAGGGEVFANSGRLANTIYMAVDRYWYLFGLTSDQFSQFTQVNIEGIGTLNVIASRGMDSGVIVVGDAAGLLVAETAGAPVDLQVVEPAIGGFEVGIIGAFEAVVVDDGAFAMITTAS